MEVNIHRGAGPLQHVIEIGPHTLLTDAPKSLGGEETGPEPHDLLAAALAACTAITVTMYAKRKGYDLQDIDVRIEHGQKDGAYVFTRRIRYVGSLADDEKARLTDIANKCPVHKTLSGEIRIVTEAV
ncbi:OsmC family protein [Noviherbaspirillum denitrificans]|uniref:Osmotically inducible protein OsmC n=1 Tax=Noviherbaspirillum denitrificans TaxID=1968433 RepID=A0A254T606_9BURK|nr:OsmC family protein [Noviherbaspirillum denitrificans]OWW18096.1 osmotically inducible protein OsmC [Noviherbaspirillum denitrificans]